MPTTGNSVETPAEKLMLQWYQGKLAERLMQATSLTQNRNLLRRGARKMQDGTLGTCIGDTDTEEEPVNIHIGDLTIAQAAPSLPPTTPAAKKDIGSLLKTLLISAALAAGPGVGIAIPWALGAFDKPKMPAAMVDTDTDTRYELRIGGGE